MKQMVLFGKQKKQKCVAGRREHKIFDRMDFFVSFPSDRG